jgi:hypothetical protein
MRGISYLLSAVVAMTGVVVYMARASEQTDRKEVPAAECLLERRILVEQSRVRRIHPAQFAAVRLETLSSPKHLGPGVASNHRIVLSDWRRH